MSNSTLAHQIRDLVGKEYMIDDARGCAAFAVQGVIPSLVVTPGSIEELSQMMACAHAEKAAVVPWGGGTRQSQGYPPERLDLLVRTSRLDRVIQYEPDDLTISVEAGMTLATLNELLAGHGQMLPLDVPLPHRSTLGGILATAADGPRRLGYGTLRDLFIGTRVVGAGGQISQAGGMVVKNVSGYDMMKLYHGSFGTLGLIAVANFKLLPRPRAAATVWCVFAEQPAAFALVDTLQSSQLTPVAVEYVGWSLPTGHKQASPAFIGARFLKASDGSHRLAVCAEGLPAAVERIKRDVSKLAEQAGAQSIRVVDGTAHTRLWENIADLPQTADLSPGEMVLRLSCLPADLASALHDVATLADQYGLTWLGVARAMSGIAYVRLRAGSANDHTGLLHCHQGICAIWPHTTVLAADEMMRPALAVWGHKPAGYALMQRIRHQFDPDAMLNPGRFVAN